MRFVGAPTAHSRGGSGSVLPTIGLLKSIYLNPRPVLEVVSMVYRSKMTQAAPFLVAASVE
jgi:hypothetical protein